jgi:UDP-N-acetylmuramate--alanine ligase
MSKIFFSGIGGSGVSAIAGFMADRGHTIAGSDRSFDKEPDYPLCNILKAKGITIFPQDGSGIDDSYDFTVFSTAVEDDQPEFIKVKKLGIPMKTRPGYLSEIVSDFRTVAVAGTSGKSTTAGMLAFLMRRLGLEPNYIGGGRVKQFRNNQNPGNYLTGKSEILVIEACESDGTIVNYHPSWSIIANLDLDHNPVEKTAEMFVTLSRNTGEKVIINGDDKYLKHYHIEKTVPFSLDMVSEYQAGSIEYQPFCTTFTLRGLKFRLSIPGKYNLYNALSGLALLSEMGADLASVAEVLPEFAGIERRFDVHLKTEKYLVIDDYAHNPHKIISLMESIKRIREQVCYIFQPHGFGPTKLMKQGYIEAFQEQLREGDHLILLPIYYAGGTVRSDISSEDLLRQIRAAGKSAEVLHEREMLFSCLDTWKSYVVFGARDETLSDFAEEIAQRLK